MRLFLQCYFVVPVIVLWGVSACSGSTTTDAACVEELCEAGEAQCFGNSVGTCGDDLKSWTYSSCEPSGTCINGACKDRGCLTLGVSACADDGSGGTSCPLDGLQQESFSCESAETCIGGICLATTCEEGMVECGSHALLTCNAGAWTESPCGVGELCVENDAGATCQALACAASSTWCEEPTEQRQAVAYRCDVEGRLLSETECDEGEVCDHGFCRQAVCGQVLADEDAGQEDVLAGGGEEDAGLEQQDVIEEEEVQQAVPGLERLPVVEFKLGGITNTFDVNARADYVDVDSTLKVSAALSGRKIEINFQNIDKYDQGSWSDTDDSEATILICYFDGGMNQNPPEGGCSVGFSHGSILFTGSIEENNGPGSRLIGEFSATLVDQLSNPLEITEGAFAVTYK